MLQQQRNSKCAQLAVFQPIELEDLDVDSRGHAGRDQAMARMKFFP